MQVSSNGVLVFFNPITGEVVERTHLTMPVARVDVLNVAGKEHVNPLLVVGKNNKVSFIKY